MCGIAGVLARSPAHAAGIERTAASMAGTLRHRGPDDDGVWTDPEAGIAFGFRRLAVIDTSADGAQPMHAPHGALLFNGEIYNYRALRAELDATGAGRWTGHSDTEVLLAAIGEWGLPGALQRLDGMFALAYWSHRDRCLWLARDRLGEKPLYHGRLGDAFVFGSELRSLREHPDWSGDLDRGAVADLLRLGYVPAPRSIHTGIGKLQPGTWLRVEAVDGRLSERRGTYWAARDVIRDAAAEPLAMSDDDAIAQLDRRLRRSVAARMHADVPLGAFLSGGIDSSTVVAMLQAESDRPVQTFAIGFDGDQFDEAPHAAAVARHLGTEHTEMYVRPQDALDVVPRLPDIFDEPFADSSQIPTILVSQLARRSVTVALTGDGGDELFGGYSRYTTTRRVDAATRRLPGLVGAGAQRGLTLLAPSTWDRLGRAIDPAVPARWRGRLTGTRVHRLAGLLAADTPHAVYDRLVSAAWDRSVVIGVDDHVASTVGSDTSGEPGALDLDRWMMAVDATTYLPDDILVKVDRASMANGLEVRTPMLDHELFEFAARLPARMRHRGNRSKWVLQEVLARYVPRALTDRRKRGFGVPMDPWLRGPLREWAGDLLDPALIRRHGVLDPEPVAEKWREHLDGTRDWGPELWHVLNFQSWYEAHR